MAEEKCSQSMMVLILEMTLFPLHLLEDVEVSEIYLIDTVFPKKLCKLLPSWSPFTSETSV